MQSYIIYIYLQHKMIKNMSKENVPKKKGVLLKPEVYDKLLKIQLNLSYNSSKRVSLEKTVEHILDNFTK